MHKRTTVCSAVLIALGGAAGITTMPAFGQTTLERVEITGSSIRRVETEGALPVQTITKDEIQRSGATSTEQLLNSLSAAQSIGSTVNATGAGASTYGRSTISLRGLEETRTLVLVNGRRLAAFAGAGPGGGGVNVNAIPLAAIERVEILRDGASAIYGSDAIAGVVNFILSSTYQGFEASVTTGKPTRSGGGGSDKVNLVGGFGNYDTDGFNLSLSAAFEKEKALFGRERDFAKTSTILPFFSGSATGQGNIQGAWQPGTGTVAGGNWVQGQGVLGFAGGGAGTSFGNPLAATDQCGDIRMFKVATPTSKGAPYCQYDSAGDVGLIPDRNLSTFSANLTFKLNDSTQLFGDALFSKSKVKQTYQPSPVRNSFLVTDAEFQNQGVDPVLLISPGSAAYTQATNYLLSQGFNAVATSGLPYAITARVFDFGPRSNTDTSKQLRIVGGVRGTFSNQDYEVAVAHNENKLSGVVNTGYFSQVALAKIINDPASGWNPWTLTQNPTLTAALQAAAYNGGTLDAKSVSDSIDAKISGDLFKLPGGMAQYAYGIQSRKEKLKTSPSPALELGDIAGLGGSVPPVNKGRTVESIFSEVNLPVIKTVEANVAFRGDHYSDVGGAVTGKAALRWQPVQQLLVRGSVGTGFRAPTLVDLWQPQSLGTSAQFNDPATGQTDIQVNALTGGNPGLKPETSKQTSIGIVFSPLKTVTASVDLFKIRVKGIISAPSAQEVVSQFRLGNPAYQGLVSLDSSNNVTSVITTLANNGTADVQGADLEVAYRDTFGFGRIGVNLAGTYFSKFDQSTPGSAVSHKVGTMVDAGGNPVIGADNGGVVLRWKHQLSGSWSVGNWTTTLTQNFYLGYEDSPDLNGDRHFVPSQSIYDAQVAYSGVKNLRLALGVKNLFDKNPPLYIPASNQFQSGFDINQYDPRARFVYVTASYKFF